eukprot:s1160_g16.t1
MAGASKMQVCLSVRSVCQLMHSAISHACGYNPISCEGAANTERLLAGIACSAPPSSWKQPKAHPENSPTGAKANQKFVLSTEEAQLGCSGVTCARTQRKARKAYMKLMLSL